MSPHRSARSYTSPSHQCVVQVLVAIGLTYGRNIAHGVLTYSKLHGPWIVQVADVSTLEFAGPSPDGFIVQCASPSIANHVRAFKRPVVNVSAMMTPPPFPSVLPHYIGIGRMVAKNFADRGFRHFTYFGYPGHAYSEQRFQGFKQELLALGFQCTDPFIETTRTKCSNAKQLAANERQSWLTRQQKPLAVMACNDSRARQVCFAALESGLLIPEEVAIIGVDNDELACESAGLPLSSVEVAADKIGFAAAELLDEILRGAQPPNTPLLIPPKAVIVRQSSDVLALEDPEVVLAIRFIRENFRRGLQVDDVVKATRVSRRNLEQRFREQVGRPIHSEIRRVQIEKASALLASSDLSIQEIAENCGFSASYYLSTTFRKERGQTPREYRRSFQKR